MEEVAFDFFKMLEAKDGATFKTYFKIFKAFTRFCTILRTIILFIAPVLYFKGAVDSSMLLMVTVYLGIFADIDNALTKALKIITPVNKKTSADPVVVRKSDKRTRRLA
tara:strand:- start:3161 stop:3487 length:327 start_codon:yes stop_codon:yes gene_type:complete